MKRETEKVLSHTATTLPDGSDGWRVEIMEYEPQSYADWMQRQDAAYAIDAAWQDAHRRGDDAPLENPAPKVIAPEPLKTWHLGDYTRAQAAASNTALSIALKAYPKRLKAADVAELGEVIRRTLGGVFADLGLADAEAMRAKTELAVRILDAIESRGLSATQAEAATGLSTDEIAEMRRAHLSRFTLERLLKAAARLGL